MKGELKRFVINLQNAIVPSKTETDSRIGMSWNQFQSPFVHHLRSWNDLGSRTQSENDITTLP